MGQAAAVGGLLLRTEDGLCFVPASVALRIALAPRITAVPGAPRELVGVALHEGSIVPVVAIGAARGQMVVCQYAGDLIGIIGAEVVRAGSFPVATELGAVGSDPPGAAREPGGGGDAAGPGPGPTVVYEGQGVAPLDVAAICARVRAGARPAAW